MFIFHLPLQRNQGSSIDLNQTAPSSAFAKHQTKDQGSILPPMAPRRTNRINRDCCWTTPFSSHCTPTTPSPSSRTLSSTKTICRYSQGRLHREYSSEQRTINALAAPRAVYTGSIRTSGCASCHRPRAPQSPSPLRTWSLAARNNVCIMLPSHAEIHV